MAVKIGEESNGIIWREPLRKFIYLKFQLNYNWADN